MSSTFLRVSAKKKLFCNILKVCWEKDNCFEEGIQQVSAKKKLFCNMLKVCWEKDNCFEEGIQQDKDRAKFEIFEWKIKRLLEFRIRMISSLRKHPFLLALRRWGRFARRNVCDSATEIPYWWRKSVFT